jgi:deazaflavin-dependent oxidoreductase (nitroreductase family)
MSVRRSLAVFNRVVANHFFGPVTTQFRAFGVLHHRGRKSGRAYRTPVKVFRRGDDYVISLPYGAGCDWARNVLAGGGCELEIRGTRISLVEPRVYTDRGEADIPVLIRFVLTRLGVTEFVALTPAVPAGAKSASPGVTEGRTA